MTGSCYYCGEPMEIDDNGISNHITEDGTTDYDSDADHVAVLDTAVKDELKQQAREAATRAIREIERTGLVTPTVYLIHADGSQERRYFDADDDSVKIALGDAVRARIKQGGVEAVMTVCDGYRGEFEATPQGKAKLALKQLLGLTVKQAGDAGLCNVIEEVLVHVETADNPTVPFNIEVPYIRHPENRKNVMVMDRTETGDEVMRERLSGFFIEELPA